jgi:hypothetical protein
MVAMRAGPDHLPPNGAITATPLLSSNGMKQVLLRVPEDLHLRLVARAQREGRSVNAVANELLDLNVDVDLGDATARVRARAAALGWLHPGTRRGGPRQSPEERQRAIDSMRGIGPVIDEILDEGRNRL